MTNLERLRFMASAAMLGAVIAGCFGHHDDTVQWVACLSGAIAAGMFL